MPDKSSIVVFAYHNVGFECLDILIKRRDNVIAVITHEDDPHEEVWFKSVAALAKQNNIPAYTPQSVNTPAWTSRIRGWNPDLMLSFYYRNMIKEELLKHPPAQGLQYARLAPPEVPGPGAGELGGLERRA
jgi:methionyl-tRNA formyltransferase